MSLYVDDAILLFHPTTEETIAVREILHLFGQASGLQVNFSKSSTSLLNCDHSTILPAIQHLGCPIVELPLTYLGIPLTIRRPTTAQLQPLVEKVSATLPT